MIKRELLNLCERLDIEMDVDNMSDEDIIKKLIELGKTELNNILDYHLGLDLEEIKKELENEGEIVEEDERKFRSLYIGKVFDIYPSGKYYTPFASSNLEPCPVCEGTGQYNGSECQYCDGYGSREALLDEVFHQKLENELQKYGIFLTSGEGDPTDVFAQIEVE